MNPEESQKLIDSYLGWLRQGLSVEEGYGACQLMTSILNLPHVGPTFCRRNKCERRDRHEMSQNSEAPPRKWDGQM